MNTEVPINYIRLELSLQTIRQVANAVIHAILFQRSLGTIQAITEEVISCPVAMISDDLVSESVSRKAETFYQSLKRRRPAQDGSLGQIAVLFTQKKSKKTWFSSTEEQVPFEIHLITVHLSPDQPIRSSTKQLEQALMKISKFCGENTAHVPGISSGSSAFPFPYEIVLDPPNVAHFSSPQEPDLKPSYSNQTPSQPYTIARDLPARTSSSQGGRPNLSVSPARVASAPSSTATALGYLEQAKGGLLVVGEKMGGAVGAVGQWSGVRN